EDLAARVEHVAPGGLVAGDACMEHEVVIPPGDRDRAELDRPEPVEDLHDPVEAAAERTRGREEVPRHVIDVVDHVGIRVNDLAAGRRMYEAALPELGLSVLGEGEFEGDGYVLF